MIVALCMEHDVLAIAGLRHPERRPPGSSLVVNVATDGNIASALVTIDTCRRVNVADSFDINLFVNDVTAGEGRTDTECDGAVTASEVPRLFASSRATHCRSRRVPHKSARLSPAERSTSQPDHAQFTGR